MLCSKELNKTLEAKAEISVSTKARKRITEVQQTNNANKQVPSLFSQLY